MRNASTCSSNTRQIPETRTTLDGGAIRAAARDAAEIWPGLGKRQVNGLPVRRVGKQVALTPEWGPAAATKQPEPAPGE